MKLKFSILFFLLSACLAGFSQDKHQTSVERLFYLGEYERVIPLLKENLNSQPADLAAQKMLAQSFFYIGDVLNAYILYKEIAENTSNDYDTYVFLGNYYYVAANKLAETTTQEEKKVRFRFRKEEEKEPGTMIETYYKASEYLEKAYIIRNCDEVRKSLIEIYTITGNKEKIAQHKKSAKND